MKASRQWGNCLNLTISQFLGSFPPQSNKTSFVLDLNHSPPFFSRSASCSLMQSRQHFLAAAAHAVKSMLFSASGIKNTTLPNTRYLPTSRNTTECYTPLRVMTGRSHPRQGVTAFGDWCSAAEARLLSRPAPGGWWQVMPRGNLLSLQSQHSLLSFRAGWKRHFFVQHFY